MAGEVARRRMNMIASHFAPSNDAFSSSATHDLLSMNCTSSLNSLIQRYDNRLYFARQGSDSQACFMRQLASEQPEVHFKSSGSTYGGYCNGSEAPMFSRPAKPGPGSFHYASEAPLFSRPATPVPNIPNIGAVRPLVQDCQLFVLDVPKFAKPGERGRGKMQFRSKKKIHSSEPNGIEWSPRIDVVEMECNYVVTVEIPGTSIKDIRVEVNDQNLTIMGRRSAQYWKAEGYSNDSISAYHKKEILRGPYQVVWPLPTDVNKDRVSAEFLDGFLQIVIPKY